MAQRQAPTSRRTFNPLFWTLAQVGSRLRPRVPPALDITTAALPEPEAIAVPTRHGGLRTLLFRPHVGTAHPPAPVVMHLHGGGFINRHPEQDRHIARFLAAELGADVLLPDYDTAPMVRYPVAEEEVLDVARWVRGAGRAHGWDSDRLLLSGVSAGAKLAINACQQLHALGEPAPLAVALTVPVTDLTRADRTSSAARPAISPLVQRAVQWSYFPDVERRGEPLASPRLDASLAACMPPTLVQTGALDTLAPEGTELARVLAAAGVEVVHREFADADHDFSASGPVEDVRRMLTEMAGFLGRHVAAAG